MKVTATFATPPKPDVILTLDYDTALQLKRVLIQAPFIAGKLRGGGLPQSAESYAQLAGTIIPVLDMLGVKDN